MFEGEGPVSKLDAVIISQLKVIFLWVLRSA